MLCKYHDLQRKESESVVDQDWLLIREEKGLSCASIFRGGAGQMHVVDVMDRSPPAYVDE